MAADYDNDGYVDFYVSNYRGDNALFHNNHDGTFTDVAETGRRAWDRPQLSRVVLRLR